MTENNQKRKLAAIMFTDIVGYSQMMEHDESGTLSFLQFHNALVRMEIEDNQGDVIKTVGDAFLAEFSSAVNAVKCAMSIQKRFLEHSKSSGETRQLRIGIHIGDVVFTGNDIFGDGVNIASRLQVLAEPGGICISGDVYHMTKHLLSYQVVPLGLKELKNVSHKVEAYQIVTGPAVKAKAAPPKRKRSWVGILFLLFLAFMAGEGWYFLSTPEGKKLVPELLSRFIATPTPVPLPTAVPSPTATPTLTATSTPTATPTPTRKPPAKKPVVKKKAVVEPEEDDEEYIDDEEEDYTEEEEMPAVKNTPTTVRLKMSELQEFTPVPVKTVDPLSLPTLPAGPPLPP